MGTRSEWCNIFDGFRGETWNPITGCTPASEGCKNCWARRVAQRLKGRYGYPEEEPFRPGTFHGGRLDQPRRWQRPRVIFVSGMGDLFHAAVSHEQLNQVFGVMLRSPEHIFLLLTKRPGRAASYVAESLLPVTPPPPNIWLGVSVENQRRAQERIPELLRIPAAKRFVSCEPLLGEVELDTPNMRALMEFRRGELNDAGEEILEDKPRLDWVICGGESGSGARPMHPDWARNLRDQCGVAGVPFVFKQWGSWAPYWALNRKGGAPDSQQFDDGTYMFRVGKKEAGRTLDGREWNQAPRPTSLHE